jgi:hypothetical protein
MSENFLLGVLGITRMNEEEEEEEEEEVVVVVVVVVASFSQLWLQEEESCWMRRRIPLKELWQITS